MSKRKPTPVSQSLDMTAARWRCVTDYGSCVGCDPSPVAESATAWNLRLPRIEDNAANKIGYVLCPHTAPIAAAHLEGRFSLSAMLGTQFADAKTPSDGVTPATFRFIIMGGLDSTSMADPDKRYWSNPESLALEGISNNGEWLMSAALAISNWSNVNGQRDAAKFAALLKAPQFIGITFGAGGDFGHGIVTVGGYAHLTADDWSNVNGQRDAAKFAALLAAPQFIGITFGAGGDFGHGIVCAGGYATLRAEGIQLV